MCVCVCVRACVCVTLEHNTGNLYKFKGDFLNI